MVTFDDFLTTEAVTAAARAVLRTMVARPHLDLQIVIHDAIYEELMAADVTPDDRFEALRFAVFDRYQKLRLDAGIDDQENDEMDADAENEADID